MSAIFHRGPAQVEANLTPMIDVTFLLIVFFVLVSQIVEVETVTMELPEPENPLTELAGEEQRAIVNVLPGRSGAALGYRLGRESYEPTPEGRAAMTARLAELLAASPGLSINLRADRDTHYQYVEPVFDAVSSAAGTAGVPGTTRINLVIVREDS